MRFATLKTLPLIERHRTPVTAVTVAAEPRGAVDPSRSLAADPREASRRRRLAWAAELVGSCVLMGLFIVVALFG